MKTIITLVFFTLISLSALNIYAMDEHTQKPAAQSKEQPSTLECTSECHKPQEEKLSN
ncbi:MAG: hypothetical protein K0Q51_535 [Rickettsiaceae bacterium]|jgi:hypothetical protein|nr:hypothetical protein [Rickettsiaceae bacterium]